MIVRLLRADGRKLTAHTVNSFTELLYIVIGFQELGYLWIAGEVCVADIIGADNPRQFSGGASST